MPLEEFWTNTLDAAMAGGDPLKSYVFKVAVEPDKFEDGRDAWQAYCPALRGCRTWGHTREEALANIREAIDLYVQDLLEAGERIPVDQGTIELPEPAVVVNV
jgi:antitoxin HicB